MAYNENGYLYEVYTLLRRVAFVGCAVSFFANVADKASSFVVLCILFLTLQTFWKPFHFEEHNTAASLSLLALSLEAAILASYSSPIPTSAFVALVLFFEVVAVVLVLWTIDTYVNLLSRLWGLCANRKQAPPTTRTLTTELPGLPAAVFGDTIETTTWTAPSSPTGAVASPHSKVMRLDVELTSVATAAGSPANS